MTVRLCLIPVEESLDGLRRGPKYIAWEGDPDPPALISGVRRGMMPFGFEPTALLAADLTAPQVSSLSAQTDVTMIPANLDNQLGANLATVQAELEALNIPADALTASYTFRQVLRGIVAIFLVAQRFKKLRGLPAQNAGSRLFPAGITLASTLGDISAGARQDLAAAASALGYDYAGLTLASTLRQVLKQLATQTSPINFLGVDI